VMAIDDIDCSSKITSKWEKRKWISCYDRLHRTIHKGEKKKRNFDEVEVIAVSFCQFEHRIGYTRNQAIEVLDRLNGMFYLFSIFILNSRLMIHLCFVRAHGLGAWGFKPNHVFIINISDDGKWLMNDKCQWAAVAGLLIAACAMWLGARYWQQALHELDPVFKKFSFSESVASLFSSLGYKRPAVIQSMYIFKQPGIGGEVVPHQDNTFLYTEPRTCTGLWLALEDATINNGCLWAILGSHKKGLVRRMVRDENGTHFDRPSPVYDQKEFVPLEVKSGALVVIHGDLIHQSFENLSPASRHAFSLHVVDTEGCKWSEDN
ncbi:hypothetical protein ACJX0J_033752, partial [Zea mays]